MATHSTTLAWRIPGTGEPGGLSSMGSHRVGHDWSDLAAKCGHGVHPVSLSSLDYSMLWADSVLFFSLPSLLTHEISQEPSFLEYAETSCGLYLVRRHHLYIKTTHFLLSVPIQSGTVINMVIYTKKDTGTRQHFSSFSYRMPFNDSEYAYIDSNFSDHY